MPALSFSSTEQVDTSRKNLTVLIFVVIVVRIIFALALWVHDGSSGFIQPDSPGYIMLAQSMLHGSFADPTPEIFRTPGYPLLLAPGQVVGHVIIVGLLENFLLAGASAWLVWTIVNDFVADSRAATWAVLLYCFEPVGLLFSDQIMSETPFTLLILVFLWFTLRFFRSPGYGNFFASILALGAATYVRPASLYLGLWLSPVFLFLPRALSWRRRISFAILFPVLFGVTLSPWLFRNAVTGDYAAFSSTGNWNLYFLSAAAVQAKVEHKSFEQVRNEFGIDHYFERHPEQAAWTPGQLARFWQQEATRIISAHMKVYLAIHARGCAVVLFDSAGTVISSALGMYPKSGGSLLSRIQNQGVLRGVLWLAAHYPMVGSVFFLLEAGLLLSYLLALAAWRRLPLEMRTVWAFTTIYFVLVSGMPAAVARYRAPFMPMICMAAGVAIAHMRAAKRAGIRASETPADSEPGTMPQGA